MREPDKKYCDVEDCYEEEYFDIDDEEEYCSWNNPYRGYDEWADKGHDDYVGRLLGDYD